MTKLRILFVIPAYNESKNICNVIDEIKKEFKNPEILIINDCSKDNTLEIIEKRGLNCISMPYNVGYAKAVQTGIKYAAIKKYDYVIQFDADGQHIAKEAKLLLKEIQKSGCDIVIGSRFLENNSYRHGFLRKTGTKIFSVLIFLICNKKITDPTSGFQCLNSRTIQRYSKMGNYPEFPDANLIIEMLLDGYSIKEIPVKMRLRQEGISMHSGIIKPIKYILKIFYEISIIIIKSNKKRRKTYNE